jgi:hypothetical protein
MVRENTWGKDGLWNGEWRLDFWRYIHPGALANLSLPSHVRISNYYLDFTEEGESYRCNHITRMFQNVAKTKLQSLSTISPPK